MNIFMLQLLLEGSLRRSWPLDCVLDSLVVLFAFLLTNFYNFSHKIETDTASQKLSRCSDYIKVLIKIILERHVVELKEI